MESHVVETQDGYFLKMFRIVPALLSEEQKRSRPALIVQHGMLSSAEVWVLNSNLSFAFKFAVEGYDVWLPNSRGNIYSRGHRDLYGAKDYFKYSFFEMGRFDLPACVDYVRNYTNQDKISYFAHSQGTSSMFSALAFNYGNMNDKLLMFVAVGPVVRLDDVRAEFMKQIGGRVYDMQWWLDFFKLKEAFGPNWKSAARGFCFFNKEFCASTNIFEVKNRWTIYPDEVVPLADQEIQNTVSVQSLIHYGQIISERRFQQYNYWRDDRDMNAAKYGPDYVDTFGTKKDMPIIPIENTNVPVFAWVGADDELARPEASEIIRQKVKTLEYYTVLPGFDHGHMNWLKEEDVDTYYNDIVTKMRTKVNPIKLVDILGLATEPTEGL